MIASLWLSVSIAWVKEVITVIPSASGFSPLYLARLMLLGSECKSADSCLFIVCPRQTSDQLCIAYQEQHWALRPFLNLTVVVAENENKRNGTTNRASACILAHLPRDSLPQVTRIKICVHWITIHCTPMLNSFDLAAHEGTGLQDTLHHRSAAFRPAAAAWSGLLNSLQGTFSRRDIHV